MSIFCEFAFYGVGAKWHLLVTNHGFNCGIHVFLARKGGTGNLWRKG